MISVRSIIIRIGTLLLFFLLCVLLPVFTSQVALADSTQGSFVGNAACASCHEAQVQDWTNSHHDLAMQDVNGRPYLATLIMPPLSTKASLPLFS